MTSAPRWHGSTSAPIPARVLTAAPREPGPRHKCLARATNSRRVYARLVARAAPEIPSDCESSPAECKRYGESLELRLAAQNAPPGGNLDKRIGDGIPVSDRAATAETGLSSPATPAPSSEFQIPGCWDESDTQTFHTHIRISHSHLH